MTFTCTFSGKQGLKNLSKKENINVKGTEITLLTYKQVDYISLTDIAKYKDEQNPS
jgi:hypothetical protein